MSDTVDTNYPWHHGSPRLEELMLRSAAREREQRRRDDSDRRFQESMRNTTNRATLTRSFNEDPSQLHPTTGRPLESYRMQFIDPNNFTTRTTYLTPSEITERFGEEVGRGVMDQINTTDTHRALTPEQIRESMQEYYNTTRSPRDFQVYTGPRGMRAFDEAMRNTLGVDLGPRKWSSNPLPKYKIPTFYEQSHTDEHYIYVFKDIVTKRQLMGDTMNQAVIFATAEMEADNELVTKCKLYE